MKVLHLPNNIASIPYYTIKALSKKNVTCKSLFINPSKYHKYPATDTTIINTDDNSKIGKIISKIMFYRKLKQCVDWADVIHWTFGQNVSIFKLNLDLEIIKWAKKPSIIEWLGSDIRMYELESKENIYYKNAFDLGYEYRSFEREALSKIRQKNFSKYGFEFAVIKGLEKFVDTDIKKSFYITDLRICLDEFEESIPDSNVDRPLIIHSPSAMIAKGTQYVLEVISRLKKRYKFDFVLINGKSIDENFEILKKADIYLDQFILGHYGMAALEAMAFGKPVLCYLKEDYYGEDLKNIPIVNTKIETLEENISLMIENPNLRVKIGKKSREFVRVRHNANLWADKFIEIYNDMLKK